LPRAKSAWDGSRPFQTLFCEFRRLAGLELAGVSARSDGQRGVDVVGDHRPGFVLLQ
jgi:hypothetical protein